VFTLTPLADDLQLALEFAREAIRARGEPEAVQAAHLAMLRERAGAAGGAGGLVRAGGVPTGAAWWDRSTVTGITVDPMSLDRAHASLEGYGALLERIEALAGPIAFVCGPLAYLPAAEEVRLFAARGFAPFSRSEMTWDPGHRGRVDGLPAPAGLRAVGPGDAAGLARLHAGAYRGRFDEYLFREDADGERDADRHVRDVLAGRWGTFLAEVSCALEVDGRLASAVLCVERRDGVLIVDVMTDPARRGEGLGRATLAGTLRALAARPRGRVYLNVTEGNRRAVGLYEGLGFVRSLGPTRDWYQTDRIPVSPDRD
jgi:ribosomal protein S18 acetylase RimI-like enzyme